MNYEQAVQSLRRLPEAGELVRQSYLDRDVNEAARRFGDSEEMDEVAKILGLVSSRRLLIADVGCGNGIAAHAMAAMGHDIICIDPDPSREVGLGAIVGFGNGMKGSVQTALASAEGIPIADESVDRVYTRQSMHHFRNIEEAMRECSRIMKRGAIFFGTREHVISDALEREVFLRHHVMQALHGQENAFTLAEYTSAIERAGLRLMSVIGRMESVINFYPGKESERVSELAEAAAARFGVIAKWVVTAIPTSRGRVARWLSKYDRYPGRLHSFLAVKT